MIDVVSPDPIGRDLSTAKAARRLPAGAACVLCGERDPDVLRPRPAGSLLEVHHLAGRRNDPDLTVVLCLNCHRRMSARMPTYGIDLEHGDRSTSDRVEALLRGLAVFFEVLARSLIVWAGRLAEEARS